MTVGTEYVVMYSSGAGSWAAARRLRDTQPDARLTLLFADTRTEDEDNYRFLRESAADLDAPLVVVADGRDVWQVFNDQRMIGNTRISNCSRTLKQRPARVWLDANADPADVTVVVGIDWTEAHRLAAIERNYQPYRVIAPLTEPPYCDRGAIFADLAARGIRRPRLYDLGFAHANCGGFCVRAGQGQFAKLLETMPGRYAEHEAAEEALRQRLDKDVAILRDRRSGRTRPLTLAALRQRLGASPEQVDRLDLGGCGCFTDDSATLTEEPQEARELVWTPDDAWCLMGDDGLPDCWFETEQEARAAREPGVGLTRRHTALTPSGLTRVKYVSVPPA